MDAKSQAIVGTASQTIRCVYVYSLAVVPPGALPAFCASACRASFSNTGSALFTASRIRSAALVWSFLETVINRAC